MDVLSKISFIGYLIVAIGVGLNGVAYLFAKRIMPNPLGNVYAATKAYVLSFSEALAEELRGTGVTVTAVCPGPTKSQFAQRSGMGKTGVFAGSVMSAEEVAQTAYKATKKGKLQVVTGMENKLMVIFSRIVPKRLVLRIAKQKLTPKK